MQVKRKYHYFYKITNNINGHFYYGVHNTDNLDDGYMGSGKRLHFAYKKYGMENFTKEILKFFDSSAEAFEYEAEVVNETLVEDINCYNCKLGGNGGWETLNKETNIVYDNNGNLFRINKNDPEYLLGKYKNYLTEHILVKDKNNKFYFINKNDSRYLSGELVHASRNCVTVKDQYGNYYQVSKDDPRYLSGELKGTFYGRKHKDETKEKLRKSLEEIQHQQGEKNSQYGTCWIHNTKENKKIKKDELESYLSKGWIKGRKMKF